MRNIPFLLWVLLLVDGVSNEENVLKEGESVTLKHGEIVGGDTMQWWFGDKMIAKFNKNNINETYPGPNNIFSGRLKLDHETGFLTIENIRPEHAGVYELKIKSQMGKSLKFNVTVNVESVSVMVGDSVTLISNDTETEEAEELVWKIEGEKKFIAKFDRKNNKPTIYDDERFSGRLQLDHQTGSLTVRNIRITDSREYQLQIKSRETKRFNVTVQDKVKSLSVMEGDNVTINTGVTGILSARLNDPDGIWINIDRNHETGEITIINIRSDQSGVYKVEINTRSMILHREYNIALDEMMTVSVKEGDTVTLRTGFIEMQEYDLILWRFGDDIIGKINKGTNKISLYDTKDKRFEGRLQLNEKSGSLNISHSKNTDSGVYHLQMSSSSHTVQRDISVTVSDSGLSTGAVVGTVVGVLLLVFAAAGVGVIYYRKKISELKGRNDVAEAKESINPLNPGTANGEGS